MTGPIERGAPLIGVVADRKRSTSGPWVDVLVDTLPHSFAAAIEVGGGVPLLVPVVDTQLSQVGRLLDLFDGLFLAGGRDLDATLYAQDPHPSNDPALYVRDRLEIELVREAHRRGMPILGACRGMQVMNVAFGGTLVQHLAETVDLAPHRGTVGVFTAHEVRVTAGSQLEGITLSSVFDIASHHHQSVDRLGDGFVVSAEAPDGVVEAIETNGGSFCLGVQWHPEQRLEPEGNALMRAFVEASARWAESGKKSELRSTQ